MDNVQKLTTPKNGTALLVWNRRAQSHLGQITDINSFSTVFDLCPCGNLPARTRVYVLIMTFIRLWINRISTSYPITISFLGGITAAA
jgi:hypothetical protein